MAKLYGIRGPVTNGEYTTESMSTAVDECELSAIQFFNSSGQQVTPTAGTVTFSGSPDGVNFRTIPNGTFNAADAYSTTRDAPYAEGLMVAAKITLSGITGADNFTATVWRA